MATFVLVPGGWHGAWVYRDTVAGLRRAGHQALAVTLTGVGERAHLVTPATNLDTHVQDVIRLLEAERIEDAVLCGHSYAGMVITGVADRAPERLAGLVYVDAYVPRDGQSCWTLTSDPFRAFMLAGARADGFTVRPPAGLDPRATGHPLASFLQALTLVGGGVNAVERRMYVYCSGWRGTPFADVHERLRTDPGWRVHTVPAGHDVMAEAPDALLRILLSAAPAG